MANEYGLAGRQQVQDMNAQGNKVASNAPTVALSQFGLGTNKKFTVQQKNMNMGWADALVQIGGQAIVKGVETAEQRKYTEETLRKAGYEGEIKHSQSFIGQMLAPESKTKRVLDLQKSANAVQKSTTEALISIREHDSKTPEEYQAFLKQKLLDTLENFDDDAEAKAMVVDQFNADADKLARQQAMNHGKWATKQSLDNKATRLDNNRKQVEALKHGDDEDALNETIERTKKEFLTKPDNVTTELFQAEQAAAIIKEISEGGTTYYDIAKEEGIDFGRQLNFQIETARDKLTRQQDAKFATTAGELEEIANSGDVAGLETALEEASKNYPKFVTEKSNILRDRAMRISKQKNQEAADKQTRANTWRSGNANTGSKAERTAAADQGMYQIGMEGVQATTGDTETPPTLDEVYGFLVYNPDSFKRQWSKGNVKTAFVTQMITDTTTLMHKSDITEEEMERFNTTAQTLRVLRDTNPALYRKQFSNEQDYVQMEGVLERTASGQTTPFAALQATKNVQKNTEQFGKVNVTGEALDRGVADIVDDFTSERGEKNLLIFDKEVNNPYELNMYAKKYLNDALQETGGNMQKAKEIAKARIIQDGTVVGNTFIPGGQAIENDIERIGTGTDLNGLVGSLNANEKVRKYLIAKGFPDHFDLTNGEAGDNVGIFGNDKIPGVGIKQERPGFLVFSTINDGKQVSVEVRIPTAEEYEKLHANWLDRFVGDITRRTSAVFSDDEYSQEELKDFNK